MQYIPRHPGTEGWRACGDYILQQFAAQGWSVEEQPFTYMDTGCRNLIAKRGSGPLLIFGAHYDSRRRADEDPDPQKRDQPVPAANDGASGVAILLELARVLDPLALGRTIWLVAFDAEDNGGLDGWDWIAGSRHFVQVLEHETQGMVLFDMIGDADQQIYYERNSHDGMNEQIWTIADALGYDTFIPQDRHSMLDDHIPFIQAGIPAVDLIDFDYPYWHTTEDTLDKVSVASLEAVGRTAEEWLLRGAPGLPVASADPAVFLPFVAQGRLQQRTARRARLRMPRSGRSMRNNEYP
jgi:Zn-dependent M28 family amino/carboxypeptidase